MNYHASNQTLTDIIDQLLREQNAESRTFAVIDNGDPSTPTLRRALATHPRTRDFGSQSSTVVAVLAPKTCTLGQLGRAILSARGEELPDNPNSCAIWEQVCSNFSAHSVKLLCIELQIGTTIDAKNIVCALKSLLFRMKRLRLVLQGASEVRDILEADDEFLRHARLLSIRGQH